MIEDFAPPPERKVVMAGPISKSSRYALIVEGDFGSREIRNLMRMLQLQLDWQTEDEAALSPASKEGSDG